MDRFYVFIILKPILLTIKFLEGSGSLASRCPLVLNHEHCDNLKFGRDGSRYSVTSVVNYSTSPASHFCYGPPDKRACGELEGSERNRARNSNARR